LAKNRAKAAGAAEAILHRGDRVTEGSSNNVFVVRAGEVWTHPADQWVLPGITRGIVCGLCRQEGIPLREEPYTEADHAGADEAFLTGTTTQVTAITAIAGRPVGQGGIGPVTRRLHEALGRRIVAECGE
jgi:D-alanine transaminase